MLYFTGEAGFNEITKALREILEPSKGGGPEWWRKKDHPDWRAENFPEFLEIYFILE